MIINLAEKRFAQTVKGFTLIEVLITIALSSITVTLAYNGLTYIQRMFYITKEQNSYLSHFALLKNRLDACEQNPGVMLTAGEDSFVFKGSDGAISFGYGKNGIWMSKGTRSDTLHAIVKLNRMEVVIFPNAQPEISVIRLLEFTVSHLGHNFNLVFAKKYDSQTLMKIELEQNVRD